MVICAALPVFLFVILWMLTCFSIWWPGLISVDGIRYLEEIVIRNSDVKDFSEESYLYGLLMKLSVKIGGGFELLILLQVLISAVLISLCWQYQKKSLKSSVFGSVLLLGAVVFPNSSLMLLMVERDIPFVWSLIWILFLQTKLVFGPKIQNRSSTLLFLGLALVLCASFKQMGFLVIPVVILQAALLRFSRKEYFVLAKSFSGFGIVFFVLLPFLLGVAPSNWPVGFGYFDHLKSSNALYEPGVFYAPTIINRKITAESSYRKLAYARNEGVAAPPNYISIAKISPEFAQVISIFRLQEERGLPAGREYFLKVIFWLNESEWRFLLIQSFLLGEIILLFLVVGMYWLPKTSFLALVPLSQYLFTIFLQPIGKGRYFYFIYLVPFFFLPLILYEIRSQWQKRKPTHEK